MTMLRQAFRLSSRRSSIRAYAAAKNQPPAVKRALNDDQLKGEKPGVSATPPSSTLPPTTPPSAPKTQSPNGGAGGGDPTAGGGAYMLPIAVVLTTLGVASYYEMIPNPFNGTDPAKVPVESKKEVPVKKEDPIKKENPIKKEASIKKEAPVKKEKIIEEKIPAKPEAQAVVKLNPEPVAELAPEPVPAPEPVVVSVKKMEPEPSPEPVLASAIEAAKELSSTRDDEASSTLQKARQALRSTVDDSLYSDLENLSNAELKVRVVQLGTELTERTKWEAIRLKEFLAMKEKEVGEKYLELMQKQRLEFEALMARQLREKEDDLTRQTNSVLHQKDAGIQAIVNATKESLEAEHQANMESVKELLQTELNSKYEVDYANKLAEVKQKFAHELEEKVTMIENLAQRLERMESALSVSRSFTDGSVQAHRVGAAALALAAKLETSKPAKAEVNALSSVSEQNSVISSAVKSIPSSISAGIPTLSELQTTFEAVYDKSRQAALVPAGQSGLEGQLMGLVFKTLKYAPSPDDPAPEESKDEAEYVLSRARRYVQLGDLDRAVEQLSKLQGQAAFTVKDWKKSATDRITADKALQVIKMEVALMNESLSKAAE